MCLGLPALETLAARESLRMVQHGMVHHYVERTNGAAAERGVWSDEVQTIPRRTNLELDANHTHFFITRNGGEDAALNFRNELRKYCSLNDLSHDDIQTPQVLLLISGDASVFKKVHDALDEEDPETNASVPVLVISDSGGAAADVIRS